MSQHTRSQQAIKNNNPQVPVKQKPLKPKVLPAIPPQGHTIQQQQPAQINKQQQSAAVHKPEQVQSHNKQSASLQAQIQQSFNHSQLQQSLAKPQTSQPQSHPQQSCPTLSQSQTQQPLNKAQTQQHTQLYNKQGNLPALQQSQKTQAVQCQHQPTVVPQCRGEQQSQNNAKVSVRQDSNVSSDSFSQNSSPSYTTKTMETPLLPHHGNNSINASQKASSGGNKKILNGDPGNGSVITGSDITSNGNAALTKSISTPASLQTIVRFHHGSNMSLHHRVRQWLLVHVC
jgi:corin